MSQNNGAAEINLLQSIRSFNNRLIVEAYKNEGGLKTTISHGIAMVSQKVTVKGLRVLVETKLADGTIVQEGSIAYIKEELLHTSAWAKKLLECADVDGQFMIVELKDVEMIGPSK